MNRPKHVEISDRIFGFPEDCTDERISECKEQNYTTYEKLQEEEKRDIAIWFALEFGRYVDIYFMNKSLFVVTESEMIQMLTEEDYDIV